MQNQASFGEISDLSQDDNLERDLEPIDEVEATIISKDKRRIETQSAMNPQSNIQPYNEDEFPESSRQLLIQGQQSSRRNQYVNQSDENFANRPKGISIGGFDDQYPYGIKKTDSGGQNLDTNKNTSDQNLVNRRLSEINVQLLDNEGAKTKGPISTYSRKSKFAKGSTPISDMKLLPIGEITGMNPKQLTAFEI